MVSSIAGSSCCAELIVPPTLTMEPVDVDVFPAGDRVLAPNPRGPVVARCGEPVALPRPPVLVPLLPVEPGVETTPVEMTVISGCTMLQIWVSHTRKWYDAVALITLMLNVQFGVVAL